MGYLAVIEKTGANYSAYVPDLPGCVATGRTREEVRQMISAAVAMHLDGMREDGLPIPEPTTSAEVVQPA